MVLLLVALVVLFVFIFQSYKQSTSPPFFSRDKRQQPPGNRNRWMAGHHHFRFWETPIFHSATGVPRAGVWLDESKVLRQRKNFEWAGS
jgi:hypothetical protein